MIMLSFQANESKIKIGEPANTGRRSKRIFKRKLVDEGISGKIPKVSARKTAKAKISKSSDVSGELSSTLSNKQRVEKSKNQIDESMQVKKQQKRKAIKYEIDCSNINMDLTDFVNFVCLIQLVQLTNEDFILAKRPVESNQKWYLCKIPPNKT